MSKSLQSLTELQEEEKRIGTGKLLENRYSDKEFGERKTNMNGQVNVIKN